MLTRRLRRRLRKHLSHPISWYRGLGATIDTKDGQLTFIDRGAPVLAVAHLDYVRFDPVVFPNGDTVRCGQLDDRLGVWVLLELLPALGVNVDVLLTDNEETGRSTAKYFDPARYHQRTYNWMFQFDRHGTDTVMYDYETDGLVKMLEAAGLKTGHGTFSDICKLDHLGCAGFNVGTGYYNEHTAKCKANLLQTCDNARKFAEFWSLHQNTHIAFDPNYNRWGAYGAWNDDTWVSGTSGGSARRNPYGYIDTDVNDSDELEAFYAGYSDGEEPGDKPELWLPNHDSETESAGILSVDELEFLEDNRCQKCGEFYNGTQWCVCGAYWEWNDYVMLDDIWARL